MTKNAPLDPRKARRVTPPLPHPSWKHDAPTQEKAKRALSATEFWERLGI